VLGDKVCVDARHRLTTILGYKYSPTNKFNFFQILDLRSKKVPKTFALQKPLKTKKVAQLLIIEKSHMKS